MSIHPELADRKCYHRYEVTPGFFTPGTTRPLEPKRCLDELGVPADLSGLRILDIGAWDGPTTFELEKRGAQVTALDIHDPDKTVFNAVKRILGSSAQHVVGSIYDAQPETLGRFDVVLYAGVYYHLKNPVLAFQRIRRLLKDDGRLFLEGAAASDYLARRLAQELGVRDEAKVLAAIDRMPLSYFDVDKDIYEHWSNWFFPTTRCLEGMLVDCGFREVRLRLERNAFYQYSHRRLMGQAQADPQKPDPENQKYEHNVKAGDSQKPLLDPTATMAAPPRAGLRPVVGRIRRRLRRWLGL